MKSTFSSVIWTLSLLILSQPCWGQMRIRNDKYIQIGYDDYRTLTFGKGNSAPNNGAWGIEHWQGGLNFWKPWPNSNWNNFILFLRDDNNIGVGFAGLSNFRFAVQGNIVAQSYWTFSDRRFKKDIAPLTNSLNKVLKLQAKSYYLAGDAFSTAYSPPLITDEKNTNESKTQMLNQAIKRTDDKEKRFGLIAQEVKEVVPEVVREDEKGYLSIDYTELTPLIIDAIKEQQSQIEQLKKQINALERTLAELKK